MNVKTLVKRSEYHDSVTLMLVARELGKLPGVRDAAVVMGTEANRAILREAGMLTPEAEVATANDLIIAVSLDDGQGEQALEAAQKLLHKKREAGESAAFRPRTLRSAVKAAPTANVAVISVAGQYAAAEAWDALHRGLHVLLFSDNVSLEDEIQLKTYAREQGLLLMGPGAGTTLLNGVALGFANVIPRGPIGIVSAAGTGLQEVSTLLAKYGVGVTQGLGVGGRDLKEAVGGIMMVEALKALQSDPDTEVLVLISKPPAEGVARRVLDQVAVTPKPTVVCFLGGDPGLTEALPHAISATTLQGAAWLGAQAANPAVTEAASRRQSEESRQIEIAANLRSRLAAGQRYLRGLFSGGTLCYEAQILWRGMLTETVRSNAPLIQDGRLGDSTRSEGHTAVDLGEEEFTVGRPHPMIDNDLRIRRMLQEAQDPEVAVLMLDVVLGYGAHPDPASELAPAVVRARRHARELHGTELLVVASVTGTDGDPQGLGRQIRALEEAGVVVCESNASAASLCGLLVGGRPARALP